MNISYDNGWRVCLYENIYLVRHKTAWSDDGHTIIKDNLTWEEAENFKRSIQKLKGVHI